MRGQRFPLHRMLFKGMGPPDHAELKGEAERLQRDAVERLKGALAGWACEALYRPSGGAPHRAGVVLGQGRSPSLYEEHCMDAKRMGLRQTNQPGRRMPAAPVPEQHLDWS